MQIPFSSSALSFDAFKNALVQVSIWNAFKIWIDFNVFEHDYEVRISTIKTYFSKVYTYLFPFESEILKSLKELGSKSMFKMFLLRTEQINLGKIQFWCSTSSK